MLQEKKKKEKRNACRTALKRSRFDGKKKRKGKRQKRSATSALGAPAEEAFDILVPVL